MIARHDTLCRRCGGKCCQKGPIVTEDELNQMSAIIGAVRVLDATPGKVDRSRFKFHKQCPALTPHGCLLLPDQRPRACRLYPFIEHGGNLVLDPACEYWRTFGEDYRKVMQELPCQD